MIIQSDDIHTEVVYAEGLAIGLVQPDAGVIPLFISDPQALAAICIIMGHDHVTTVSSGCDTITIIAAQHDHVDTVDLDHDHLDTIDGQHDHLFTVVSKTGRC